MREPADDVLVLQHVEQRQVGAVGPGPDPVAGARPAECRVQPCQVAGGDHHLVNSADAQAPCVEVLYLADLAEARKRVADQVLDIDQMKPARGELPPRDRWLPTSAAADDF